MELVSAPALVERLDELTSTDDAFVDALRPALAHRRVEPLIEYLAERLGLESGERRVSFEFSDGNLRRTRLDHGPVGNEELEQLAHI